MYWLRNYQELEKWMNSVLAFTKLVNSCRFVIILSIVICWHFPAHSAADENYLFRGNMCGFEMTKHVGLFWNYYKVNCNWRPVYRKQVTKITIIRIFHHNTNGGRPKIIISYHTDFDWKKPPHDKLTNYF